MPLTIWTSFQYYLPTCINFLELIPRQHNWAVISHHTNVKLNDATVKLILISDLAFSFRLDPNFLLSICFIVYCLYNAENVNCSICIPTTQIQSNCSKAYLQKTILRKTNHRRAYHQKTPMKIYDFLSRRDPTDDNYLASSYYSSYINFYWFPIYQ
jgi:hypothetical protein